LSFPRMQKRRITFSSKSPVLTYGRTICFIHFHGQQLMD
jgi:hypothetical protein